MKSKVLVRILILVVLGTFFVIACLSDPLQLHFAANRYNRLLDGELPEDMTLTIYYVPVQIATRFPWSVEDLLTSDLIVKLVVYSDDLAKNLQTLKRLGSADWLPSDEDMYLNARIYYVFETGGKKVLEVALWTYAKDAGSESVGALVNGIEVKGHTAFLSVVIPFLPESHRKTMGLMDVPADSVDFDE